MGKRPKAFERSGRNEPDPNPSDLLLRLLYGGPKIFSVREPLVPTDTFSSNGLRASLRARTRNPMGE